jgi:hypothetical protein
MPLLRVYDEWTIDRDRRADLRGGDGTADRE